jgi:hypothetical protein
MPNFAVKHCSGPQRPSSWRDAEDIERSAHIVGERCQAEFAAHVSNPSHQLYADAQATISTSRGKCRPARDSTPISVVKH